jgi:ATP-dependent RNA helicase DDX51/DBP6
MVQTLAGRVVPRLRGLILVPSRDLALQVGSVLQPLCGSVGLRHEVVIGQHSFAAEQERIMGWDAALQERRSVVDILVCTPGRLMDHLNAAAASSTLDSHRTPSLNSERDARERYTFHLHDLEMLVVDEADRLLSQSYQDWPARVLAAVHVNDEARMVIDEGEEGDAHDDDQRDANNTRHYEDAFTMGDLYDSSTSLLRLPARCVRRRVASGVVSASASFGLLGALRGHEDNGDRVPLQKLLFSATLQPDPQKLSQLQLRRPLYVSMTAPSQRAFQLPLALKCWVVHMADQAQKPLVLLQLLRSLRRDAHRAHVRRMQRLAAGGGGGDGGRIDGDEAAAADDDGTLQVLIFTSSVDSTHRLARLLEVFDDSSIAGADGDEGGDGGGRFRVAEFSSALSQEERSKLVRRFKQKKINMCVEIMRCRCAC